MKPKRFYPDFKPGSDHLITTMLIGLNIVIFSMMILSGMSPFEPDSAILLKWGANYGPSTTGGEWWRLLTCNFLHIGIVHLVVNVYFLFAIGLLVEPLLGRVKFAVAYLLTGILPAWPPSGGKVMPPGAGASGATGNLRRIATLLTTDVFKFADKKPLLISVAVVVVMTLLYGMAGNIDNAGHVGGLLAGLGLGYAFYPALKQPGNRGLQSRTIILSVWAVSVLVAGTYFHYR